MWIFGYGSLIWRPGFLYERACTGWLHGYGRRFFQGSTDHRGVPGTPGRVVTLIEQEGESVCGRCFWVKPETADEVLRALDKREQGGYERISLSIDAAVDVGRNEEVDAVTYIALPSNRHYLGPASMDVMAEEILHAAGPSGSNLAYLQQLTQVIRALGGEDRHVMSLEETTQRLLQSSGLTDLQ